MLNIIIATDQFLLRYGVKHLLAENGKNSEIAQVRNAAEATALLHRGAWSLFLLDRALSRWRCLEILEEVRLHSPRLPILIINLHADDLLLRQILGAGASGYLAPDSAPEEFVLALRTLRDGGRYVSASLAEQVVFDLQKTAIEPGYSQLSNREWEVLHLIACGKTVSEIALMLSLSVKTISTYRSRILKKLDMQTSAELIRYALQNGLV